MMQNSQEPLCISPGVYLPWPSALPTQDCPYGPTPLVDHPVHDFLLNATQASGLVYIAPQTAVAEKAPDTHTQSKTRFGICQSFYLDLRKIQTRSSSALLIATER